MAPATEGLARRVAAGVGWNVTSQVLTQATRVAVAIVLARLLTPAEFGLAGMALVLATLGFLFTDLSLGAALVQRPTLTENDRSTIFWTTVALGIAVAGASALASPLVADFFGEPGVRPLFAALSVSFLLSALSAAPTALLVREMRFRALQLCGIASVGLGACAGIAFAAAGAGAWAIVIQTIVQAAANAALIWAASSWRPKWTFSLSSLRDVGGYGISLFGSRLLDYGTLNGDNLLIGRFLGPHALGIYSLAYSTMFTPILRFAIPIQQVVAPAFSRMQHDPVRLAQAWLRTKAVIAGVLVPVFMGMIVVAPDLVQTLFGARWYQAVPVLRLLACAGIATALVTVNWSVLQASGHAATLLRLNLGVAVVTVAAFAAGLRWGAVGVAGLFALARWLLVVPHTWATARRLPVSTRNALVSGGRALPVAIVSSAIGYALRAALVASGTPAAFRLAAVTVVAGAAYLALAYVALPALFSEVRAIVRGSGSTPRGEGSSSARARATA